jgi:hypothetical protein
MLSFLLGGVETISARSAFETQFFSGIFFNNNDKTITSELIQNLKIYSIQPYDFFGHSITRH